MKSRKLFRTAAQIALALAAVAVGFQPCLAAAELTFPETHFRILDPDTKAPLGRSEYRIESVGAKALLHGENHYDSGLSDTETAHLTVAVESGIPLLIDFDHTFYKKDGSIQERSHVDMGTGYATCTYNTGTSPSVMSDRLTIPPDTWAGASIAIPLQRFLRAGEAGPYRLHVFNCAPTPKIFAIDIQADPGEAIWVPYAHTALRMELRPNLGWYNVIISPFLPRLSAWFDPKDQWNFVGSEAARYYKGPKIMLVKSSAVPSPPAMRSSK
ncbi:MAG: hypothetical protein JWM69_1585 [Candidatus Binatus sp.]|nr:hypothetical protein [Candidatus Binatus sp.]